MRRFAMALALLAVVPASSVIIIVLVDVMRWRPWIIGFWDDLRQTQFCFALIWTLGLLIACRGFFSRKLRPLLMTLLVCSVPFLQAIWGNPIWSNRGFLARGNNDALEIGQHTLLCGFFVWLLVAIWLIAEQQAMRENEVQVDRNRTMSPLA